MSDLSAAQGVLLTTALCAAVYLVFFLKKCSHSENLIRKAEQGDQSALEELIRLDLEGLKGVVLAVQQNRHYDYGHTVNAAGETSIMRCRTSSFPSRRFIDFYANELKRRSSSPAYAREVLNALDYCGKPQLYD